ncbi:MAG: ParB/RepB/Spo0J family partition protein [Pleurocapsa sp. SU_196_0]|nr:ParB/RepB/Spo0J family partition protein [Pleurocapsa sp. SU_196_0]
MSKNSKTGGLGRGLDALIPRGTAPTSTNKLPVNQLEGNKKQPRTVFDDAALEELSKSIAEKGVLQPLLVRPKGKKYEIVAGERRWRAAKLAGLTEVPVVIRELDDRETLEIALIENLQREDLNPLEEARAFQGLLDLGSTQDQVAKALGKGRSTITNSLRLLLLSRDAQQALEEGIISAGHARAILALPKENHDRALEQIVSNDLNVRQAEALRFDVQDEGSRETLTAKPRVHRQLELELTRLAGTKVRIVGQDKGKLELYYHNLEDLNRILEMIGYEG